MINITLTVYTKGITSWHYFGLWCDTLHERSSTYMNNYGQMVNHVVCTFISLLCSWLPSQLGSHFHQHQYRRLDVLCGGPGSHVPVQYRTWQHCTHTEWCTTHQHHSHLTVFSQMKLQTINTTIKTNFFCTTISNLTITLQYKIFTFTLWLGF